MIGFSSVDGDESRGGPSPDPDLALRVDRVCDEFEDAWRAGGRPRIEDFLEGVGPPERPAFIRSLIDLEIGLEREDARRNYGERFPECAELAAELLAEPGDLPDRFQQLTRHAAGGMGVVYLANDAEIGRRVALKRIKEAWADDPAIQARFVREATLTGRLEHPGVVPVYGMGREADGRPYYVMRFVEGRSLRQEIDRLHRRGERNDSDAGAPPTLRSLLNRFVAACYTLSYAHSRLVIHRDVKPENIVLGDYGETLVIDWGLARRLDPGESAGASGSAVGASPDPAATSPGGTSPYMSPEQFEDRADGLGPRTDVFGLGGTLYCLLTGRPPKWIDPDDVARQDARGARLYPPRAVDPAIPRPLEAICLKAMALEPSDRYQSAEALARDVERWLSDEPISAEPDPWSDRVLRALRRHRTAAVAAAAALLVAAIGLAVVVVIEDRANRRLLAVNDDLKATNETLQVTNDALTAARESARSRYTLALDAIGHFHRGISEDVMLKQAGFTALRDRFLGSAMGFYRDLADLLDRERRQVPGDPREVAEAHRVLAAARRNLGRLSEDTGQPDKALAAYNESRDLLSRLHRENPSDRTVTRELANTLADLGNLHFRNDRPKESCADYLWARTLCHSLLDSAPDDRIARKDLAQIFARIAQLLFSDGRQAEAIESMEEARQLQRKVVEAVPKDDLEARGALGKILYDLGLALLYTGRRDAALGRLEESLKIREEMMKARPLEARYANDLALSLMYIGMIHRDAGRHQPADGALTRAMGLQRPLAETYPGLLKYRSDLSAILDTFGMLRKAMGRADEALRLLEEARALRERLIEEDRTWALYQSDLADTLSNLGRIHSAAGRGPESLELFRRATAIRRELTSFGDVMLYNIACELAMSVPLVSPGEASALADEAMETLRRAVDRGYRDVYQITADQEEALVSLRDRADFKVLLMDLAFPSDPIAW